MEDELRFIRDCYDVPAYVGKRILYKYENKKGTINGKVSDTSYLSVTLDGETHERVLHPTWEIEYLSDLR
ncbi:MAG: hypothetical protein GY862_07655 [Gammaproteobacteria bacterium]|nr:hypothetical protein [Gammaproteobacteria bacterium]